MPVRALVMPLALSPERHAIYPRLADLYNRVWNSTASWCDAHHRNHAHVQAATLVVAIVDGSMRPMCTPAPTSRTMSATGMAL